MDKEKVIKLLKEALLSEERVIPIYNKHLSSSISWASLGTKETARIKAILSELITDSERHKNTVKKILEDLNKGD